MPSESAGPLVRGIVTLSPSTIAMIASRAPTALPVLLALLVVSSAEAQRPSSPHAAYWQQAVRYEINARLDESRFELAGGELIEYVNNSPDTLSTFSLHLYLNAFRPGSRWSDADSVERRRRFNDLKDPDYAYNHVRNVRIMGETVEPIYPFAPDSTIVRFVLPRPLPPGGSMQVGMDWDARPSTLPRRQGAEGGRTTLPSGIPRSWSTTNTAGTSTLSIRAASSTVSSRPSS
jgi:hypothetical protein